MAGGDRESWDAIVIGSGLGGLCAAAYLCGASTPSGPGIAGVMRGGVVAAGAVLEVDLLKMVLDGQVLGDRDLLPEIRAGWDPWRESH